MTDAVDFPFISRPAAVRLTRIVDRCLGKTIVGMYSGATRTMIIAIRFGDETQWQVCRPVPREFLQMVAEPFDVPEDQIELIELLDSRDMQPPPDSPQLN